MSISYQDLRTQTEAVITAQSEALTAKLERDNAKYSVDEAELNIRFDGLNTGKLDGKNADQRAAQEANLQRSNPMWQTAIDRFRHADEAVKKSELRVSAETMRLRSMAMGLNMQIAEQTGGSAKLLSEIGLAGV